MPDPKHNEHVPVIQGDRLAPRADVLLPVVVVLDRLRSAFNVGNIFRAADAVRASEVVTCGYTATPPHPKLAKTARGCDRIVPCRHSDETAPALNELRAQGVRVYGIETAAEARPFWTVDYRFPAAVVLGNEALGLSDAALQACDEFVCLPAYGRKNSINVGNCAAVVLYEMLRQWLERTDAAGQWAEHEPASEETVYE